MKHSVHASSLAEVLDRILDKGIVIDAYVIVSLVGIELLAVELRAVIASVETWLLYAEAVGLTEEHHHHHDHDHDHHGYKEYAA
ncbi:gas vesicle protein GvpJ [Candidatus Formimonas warabiya]|uniref:Gas vesicle protein A n=1 Tax=Formimonas warabiya TaxID=1761012 RepID=A0A3G1KWW7_FORW1|nr:gas vesicle protein GvpJ [Candidatus Formimonas warabiya]ATW26946.1 gas vesicle synthesis protein GvpA [Candidatus Formimonas warabiya]